MNKMTPYEFIRAKKLNMTMLAERMSMPKSTFLNKLNMPLYHFKHEEQSKLLDVLEDYSKDIKVYVKTEKRKLKRRKI